MLCYVWTKESFKLYIAYPFLVARVYVCVWHMSLKSKRFQQRIFFDGSTWFSNLRAFFSCISHIFNSVSRGSRDSRLTRSESVSVSVAPFACFFLDFFSILFTFRFRIRSRIATQTKQRLRLRLRVPLR